MTLAHRRLLALLSYDPATGIFTRRITTSSNARAGDRAGSISSGGYRYLSIDGRIYKANRIAWFYVKGVWPIGLIDHKNRDTNDDRWDNLREATHPQNCANTNLRKDNTSGLKGVRQIRSGRWQARLGSGGGLHIGTFDSRSEAEAAFASAARDYYGDFASIA